MTISTKSVTRFVAAGLAAVRRRVYVLLLLLFFVTMGLAGFVFWQYGYQASLQEPEVTVRTVATKENDLRALIATMDKRTASRDAILGRTFQDPFIKPEVAQP